VVPGFLDGVPRVRVRACYVTRYLVCSMFVSTISCCNLCGIRLLLVSGSTELRSDMSWLDHEAGAHHGLCVHRAAVPCGVEARSYMCTCWTSWLDGHMACGREHWDSTRLEARPRKSSARNCTS